MPLPPTAQVGKIPPERWVWGARCLPLPPTAQVGKIPRERWVWGARCLPLPPTAHVGSTPYMGWAHLHGGQSPFSPQLKTNFAPPCPSLPPLLAVVTAMLDTPFAQVFPYKRFICLRNWPLHNKSLLTLKNLEIIEGLNLPNVLWIL